VLAAAAMDRWLAKLIGLVLVFVLPFAFTVLPHHMKRCMERHGTRGPRILCLFMCFGGGIFLATYLLHMGPEVCRLPRAALSIWWALRTSPCQSLC